MQLNSTIPARTIARFWAKVKKGGPDECWPWLGKPGKGGYGYYNGTGAHRIAWAIVNGPIPEGALICHECDNPPCCNPGHLWPGTHRDNFLDMVRKGRANKAYLKKLKRGQEGTSPPAPSEAGDSPGNWKSRSERGRARNQRRRLRRKARKRCAHFWTGLAADIAEGDP